MIADEPRIWQVDVSVSPYDTYRGTERIRLEEQLAQARELATTWDGCGKHKPRARWRPLPPLVCAARSLSKDDRALECLLQSS